MGGQVALMHPLRWLTFLAIVLPLRAAPEWKLVWSDEFEKTGQPDPSRWSYEQGFVRNHEAQFYTANRPENARVEHGCLILEARREEWPVPPAAQADGRESAGYTAASVITKGQAAWQYGRIEVRAKIPSGRGIWPAIWMLGANIDDVGWPRCGEIDITEHVGWQPDTVHANLHNSARFAKQVDPAAAHLQATLKVARPEAEFHRYTLEWDAEQITIAFDDQPYLTCRNPHTGTALWPYDQPFYLLMNVAVGGAWGGEQGIDDRIFPQRMEVDYVRVYQRTDPAAR
jgi:beta-glucanase (GH16 family)